MPPVTPSTTHFPCKFSIWSHAPLPGSRALQLSALRRAKKHPAFLTGSDTCWKIRMVNISGHRLPNLAANGRSPRGAHRRRPSEDLESSPWRCRCRAPLSVPASGPVTGAPLKAHLHVLSPFRPGKSKRRTACSEAFPVQFPKAFGIPSVRGGDLEILRRD